MQFFSGLNLWAVLLAAGVSFLFGGLWYGALAKHWMEAAGLTEAQVKGPGGASPLPFVITILAQIVMACMLAGLIWHLAKAGLPANPRNGLITALLIWLGFIVTTLVVNHQFQMQKVMLTLIDAGHWLGVVLIQGAILGQFAIR